MQNTTNKTYQKRDWDQTELGVLWERELRNGGKYFTGKVNINGQETELVVFSNKSKFDKDTGKLIEGKEKHPDFRIYLSEKRENAAPTKSYSKTPSKTAATRQTVPAEQDNDII